MSEQTVYVVTGYHALSGSSADLLGVYSTPEKAQEVAQRYTYGHVEPVILDK
jgi:hypothetical protein